MAPPCSPRSCPRPGGAVSPQMAAPSSDAAGRTGQDTVSSGAVEGGCGPEDVAWTWVPYVFKEIPSSIHTVPGLRKVLETFVACIVFAFLSNTSLSLHQSALEWPLLHLLHPSSRGHAAEAG
ncbi:hypothetical protein MG293_014777 [Ovis ammon polii]|uniref:Uncharacterized protein n=1 Tax=Ovis ammon polii TaxID=230172 RepID=A0AAD4TY73_OVIAM|nr:hypothetical protein MG293_014777 [Ovis ammon polii]